MPPSPLPLLYDFHRKMGLPVDADFSDAALVDLRLELIREEFAELVEATRALQTDGDTPAARQAVLKELADLAYVVYGYAVSFGLPLDAAIQRIHESNLSKLVDGKPLKREDGKVLKGPNYHAPDLADLVN